MFWKGKQLKDTSVKSNTLTKYFSRIPKASDFSKSKDQGLAKTFFCGPTYFLKEFLIAKKSKIRMPNKLSF